MGIQVTPIPRLTSFAAPALGLGLANAAGTADTTIATDSTLLVFDTTVPDSITFGQSAATGSAVVVSRRDHSHGMAAEPDEPLVLIGTVAASDDASLTVTGLDGDTTYGMYIVDLSNMIFAADSGNSQLRFGDSGGISTSGYGFNSSSYNSSTGTFTNGNVGTNGAYIIWLAGVGFGFEDTEGMSARLFLTPGNGTQYARVVGPYIGASPAGTLIGGSVHAELAEASFELTQVQFSNSAGNVTTGRMSVYGVSHA